MKPYVSIGLPVFNGEKYLSQSLDSILAQTFGDFELIISDNASTDKTQEICKEYALKDRRIRYHRNDKNVGAPSNYNCVFQLSNATYFKWISSDDLAAPELLERCVKVLDTSPDVVLCYPKTVIIDENGKMIRKYEDRLDLQQERPHERLAKMMKVLGFANPVFGLMRSDVLRKTRLMGHYIASDLVLLMELCLLGKFYEIPEHLFFRRDHQKNFNKLSLKEIKEWWDPNLKKTVLNLKMNLVFEMFKTVSHMNLSLYEKVRCYIQIRHWQIRQWRVTGGKYKALIKERLFSLLNVE